jgi:hypothetical protein
MNVSELKNLLMDSTGKIWRLADADKRGHVFDYYHPDSTTGDGRDGVQVTWKQDSDLLQVWSEDSELIYAHNLSQLDGRFTLAVEYAQMAGGLQKHYPNLTNKPNLYSCTKAVEAIQLSGDMDPGFCGSEEGISWWHGQDFVCEFDNEQDAFIIWSEGMYWIAGTPAGYVKALEKAKADKERMLFNQMKADLEK